MNVYKQITEWLSKCPSVDNYIYFNVIPSDTDTTSVTSVPNWSIIQEFIDGSVEKEVKFNINLIKLYDEGTSDLNLMALQSFEEIDAWIEEQDKLDNYPDFEGKIINSIRRSYTTPEIYVNDDGKCRFEGEYVINFIE